MDANGLGGDENAPEVGKVELEARGKWARFAREYLIDRNGKQAAIRAGYAAKHAEQRAAKLLKDLRVRAIIDAGEAQHLAGISERGRKVIAKLEELAGLKGDVPVEDLKVQVKALELIGKHERLFIERQEIAGEGGGPVVVEVVSYADKKKE